MTTPSGLEGPAVIADTTEAGIRVGRRQESVSR